MTTTKKCKALKIEGNVVSLKMDSKILKLVRITSLIVSIIHTWHTGVIYLFKVNLINDNIFKVHIKTALRK
jgi:hypothetical protein